MNSSEKLVKVVLCVGILAVLCLVAVCLIWPRCRISDSDAKKIAVRFCREFNIAYRYEDAVAELRPNLSILGTKTVVFGPDKLANQVITIDIDCRSGLVAAYHNPVLRMEVIEKYGGWHRDRPPWPYVKWPAFIPEMEARKILESLAAKLELPGDMVFAGIARYESSKELAKEGLWIATWVRERNGYKYESDKIIISVLGVTGQFVDLERVYVGTPCPTDMNISKERAIELALDKLKRIIGKEVWERAKTKYEVSFAEPLIIQSHTLWNFALPWRGKNSRLAWVIKLEIRDLTGWEKIGAPPQLVEVRVDAANGEYLGSRHSR